MQMQSWWESVSKARSRILALSSLLSPSPSAAAISSIADSDRPAPSLLHSPEAYAALSSALSSPLSGSGSDPLCHWLYDTFQLSSDDSTTTTSSSSSADADAGALRLLVLSLLPLLCGLYFSRIFLPFSAPPPSLAGFEAVLLSLYASETKARAGKPVLISVPDLSQPSLYHTPRPSASNKPSRSPPSAAMAAAAAASASVSVVSAPLEPQIAVKSTKRACIVGVALDCYYKHISLLPSWSKLELCRFAADWAGQDCPCKTQFDDQNHQCDGFSECRDIQIGGVADVDSVALELGSLGFQEEDEEGGNAPYSETRGRRIPLPWELFQPILRILAHCLLAPSNPQQVKDAAGVAVRCLYARASHELLPQAILATTSLIKLDIRSRAAARTAAASNASAATTPSKSKKPEILLVSK